MKPPRSSIKQLAPRQIKSFELKQPQDVAPLGFARAAQHVTVRAARELTRAMSNDSGTNLATLTTNRSPSGEASSNSWVQLGDAPYLLGPRIASGGMGTVHLGLKHGALGFKRLLAVKRLHAHLAQDPEFVARFKDEIRLVSRLGHPNVIQTFDVLETPEELTLVMEYCDGVTLHHLLKDAAAAGVPAPVPLIVGIMAQALHGLHSAHELTDDGVPLHLVHRDVSPQNIMVGRDGLVKILDFGIAKAASESHVTRTGQLSGKAAYMSPEQVTGHVVDKRSDIFAAGVVLWEALTGERLFRPRGAPETAALRNVLELRVKSPGEFRPGLSPALEQAVMRAIERDPARRFGSARDFALALEEAVPQASLSAISNGVLHLSGSRLSRAAVEAPAELNFAPNADSAHALGAEATSAEPSAVTVGSELRAELTVPLEGVSFEHSNANVSKSRSVRRVAVLAMCGVALCAALGLVVVTWVGGGTLEAQSPLPSKAATTQPVAPAVVAASRVEPMPTIGSQEAPLTAPETVLPVAHPIRSTQHASERASVNCREPAKRPAVNGTVKPALTSKTTNCSPPTYTDAEGIQHFKPECL